MERGIKFIRASPVTNYAVLKLCTQTSKSTSNISSKTSAEKSPWLNRKLRFASLPWSGRAAPAFPPARPCSPRPSRAGGAPGDARPGRTRRQQRSGSPAPGAWQRTEERGDPAPGPRTKQEGSRRRQRPPQRSGPGPALRHGEGRGARPGQPRRRGAEEEGKDPQPCRLAPPISLPLGRARGSGTRGTAALPRPGGWGPRRSRRLRSPKGRPPQQGAGPAPAPPPAVPPSRRLPSPCPPPVGLQRDGARRSRAAAASSSPGAQSCPSHNGLPVLHIGRGKPTPADRQLLNPNVTLCQQRSTNQAPEAGPTGHYIREGHEGLQWR